jgi:4-carboxymuconolactone decarboxylase
MARVPQIAGKADVPESHQHVVDQVLEVFGRVRGPFSILLHSPELAERLLPMVPFSRKGTVVAVPLRFVGILATVREKEAAYVWAAQVNVARQSGLSEKTIDVLRAKGDIGALPPEERDVATYARQLALKNRVDQAVFDTLQKRHGTKWLVELTAIMSFYSALCGVVNAFEVPAPDDGDRLPA